MTEDDYAGRPIQRIPSHANQTALSTTIKAVFTCVSITAPS